MKNRSCFLIAFSLLMAAGAYAEYANQICQKLGRGVADVISLPIEIGVSINETCDNKGPVAGWTYGVVQGVYNGVERAVVGAYEIVSFPIPQEPIMDPEFLLAPESK